MKALLPAIGAIFIAGCVASPEPRSKNDARSSGAAHARIDWFEYEGSDPYLARSDDADCCFWNPVLPGFYPDPSIVRVDDRFVLVNSSFSYFPGIPVFVSRDLVNWTQAGNAIDRASQLDFQDLGMSRGVFAPDISYRDGVYYILNTCVDCGGNFVITASAPEGPWSDPVWLPEVRGIDPSLFFDDDGRAYVINNDAPAGPALYDGHRALWIQEFDAASLKTFGPRKMVVDGGVDLSKKPVWIEGPHLVRRNGQLYLIAAEGGTAEDHSQVVFKAEGPFGPYTPYAGNPIMTQRHLPADRSDAVTSVGHADFIEDDSGETWAVFLGVRPYAGGFHNTGRETFLAPVRWKDGWPIILEGDEIVPRKGPRPDMPKGSPPSLPVNGNFSLREEFDGDALAAYWISPRQHVRPRWRLQDGALVIPAGAESLGGFGRPNFVARRQQHQNARATMEIDFKPAAAEDLAGIAAYYDDEHFLLLAIAASSDGGRKLQLRRRDGSGPPNGEVIAEAPIETDGSLVMRVAAEGRVYSFDYRTEHGDWRRIGDNLDGAVLSTQKAGGFIGVVFGPFAYSVR